MAKSFCADLLMAYSHFLYLLSSACDQSFLYMQRLTSGVACNQKLRSKTPRSESKSSMPFSSNS